MPPKKTNIGRKSTPTKRQTLYRDAESDIQQTKRRRSASAHIASVRETESDTDHEERLSYLRRYAVNSRTTETNQQRDARLQLNAACSSASRSAETLNQGDARRQSNAARMSGARAAETPTQRDARRQSETTCRSTSRLLPWARKQNAAFQYRPTIDYASDTCLSIGRMNVQCNHCSALKWKGETKGMCCSAGKVDLPPLNEPPEPLHSLLITDTREAKDYRANIRKYNGAFQMTSFGTTGSDVMGGYMPTFKVQGQVYHLGGSLLPDDGQDHKFLQIYFIGDEDEQARIRGSHQPGVKQDTIIPLQRMLHERNTYVRTLKSAMERIPSDEYSVRILENRTPAGEHSRRYNAPVVDDVAIVIVGDDFMTRDIIIRTKSQKLKRITETHRSYDALQYPLLFWEGDDGYAINIPHRDPITGQLKQKKKVSANEFYAYRIMYRRESFNILLRCGHLFHQFITDMYAKIEGERLAYFRANQKKLRAENYIHLRDAVRNDKDVTDIGQMIILPSTFTGGPRYMHERTQDALTYVRHHGRPDLFITFTCNPKWVEVQDELFPQQTPQDRHDLLARVFRQKVNILMNLIVKGHVFGNTLCHMYTTEWQKRGLPHVHILIWLQHKIRPDQTDDVISAELPNPETDPELFDIVTRNMIHGPCGRMNPNSPCMKDKKCTKRYPHEFLEETMSDGDGYPLYRRRKPGEGGFEATLKVRGKEVTIDNRWVVPHNRLLIKLFNAHINVEICNSVKSIKYICKYVNKGSDQACFGMEKRGAQRDEIERYELGRYLSSNEAVWRVLGFKIHERYPAVVKLSVHLPDGQRVYFTVTNIETLAESPPSTTLTAFFELCTVDDFAKTLLYWEVPSYYTWDVKQRKFNRRKQGTGVENFPGVKKSDVLGRVYTVHPTNFECFCLRLLLHVIRGPTCFEELKTYEGNICETFQECACKLGMLEDDSHWNSTLEEAAVDLSANQMRTLFAIMIRWCNISDPKTVWQNHKDNLAEDILHRIQRDNPDADIAYNDAIYAEALVLLEDKVLELGGNVLSEYGMSAVDRTQDTSLSRELLRETSYNIEALQATVDQNEPMMTEDQQVMYRSVLHKLDNQQSGIIFVDAPGGTGKTFVLNLLLAKIRLQRKIALAVAFSGIAATLLDGGRTAHSTFKLPLNLTREESPTCNISKGSGMARVLQECTLIVWDECTMMHKNGFEALDRTLKDIRGNDLLMGGVLLLLAGDFRQTLPIVMRGTAADEIRACLKMSYLWRTVETLTLTTNMRVHVIGDETAREFSDKLLEIGNGQLPRGEDGLITIPSNVAQVVPNVDVLKKSVFPDLKTMFDGPAAAYEQWMCERAILAPRNDMAEGINVDLLQQLPGEPTSYISIDKACGDCEEVDYPTEFLNTLQPPGTPPHHLSLKVGAPIILLRNIDPPKLCNGTRLIVKTLMPNLIEATILTGCAKGAVVYIPRIPIVPGDLAIEFKRIQFPLKLSFAMSINRAQGQSLKVAGVQLESPCFSHGQFYVACSRVGTSRNLYVYAPAGRTANIVYPRALR